MSTVANKKISSIPIKVIDTKPKGGAGNFKWKRRTVQIAILILLVLIPVSGLFRIDPENGALVVLGWQIWFADFFLISGLWITILSVLVALYSIAGTVVCGWACPQNTVSEWANHMTRKLLGKRAEISLDGEGMVVAAAKNKSLRGEPARTALSRSQPIGGIVNTRIESSGDICHRSEQSNCSESRRVLRHDHLQLPARDDRQSFHGSHAY